MANKIIIPHEFKLNNKVIKVEYDNDYCNENGYYGESDFTEKLITMCDEFKGVKLPLVEQNKTFFHELTHLLLDACKRHTLKYNEEFVEEFSQKLYEFSRTAKY